MSTAAFEYHAAKGPVRAYIGRDDPGDPSDPLHNRSVRGWQFVVWREEPEPTPIWDSWEMLFEEIARYPEGYGFGDVLWREEVTGELYSIAQLIERHRGY